MSDVDNIAVQNYFEQLQDQLCVGLETLDASTRHASLTAKQFVEDAWQRPASQGGGRSRVLKEGRLFEQAGVNYSLIHGDALPPTASARRPELAGRRYSAMGVSLVLHPRNPFVPTAHMNVRFFVAHKDGAAPVWWFGGGYDLTPYYGFREDAKHWHQSAQSACAVLPSNPYERYKQWCDEYFYIKHRQEPRGIGGLFFDDLNEPGFADSFNFAQSIGDSFLGAYSPIAERRREQDWTEQQRQFQLYRRGRYVEFNLVHDRGTLFGLQSGGRTESILMSMPPLVRWEYSWTPAPNSPEAELYDVFLQPQNWLAAD